MSTYQPAKVVTDSPPVETRATPKKFGTFLGVYTPSVLTILGVMMYLRFGWVVGNVGLPRALLLVVLASSITFVTGLSASAVATNMRVGVGGEYYMISRSLGLELGGAIGIPLFLCRTLSLTLYCFGLAETIGFVWPHAWGEVPIQWLAAGFVVATTAIAGKSADLSLKLQLPIMGAVALSVVALAVGVLTGETRPPPLEATYLDPRTADGGFWFVFAVFFPAVTGFTAGIGMSGDLKDPKRSIPRGTMLAVVTGCAVYLLIPFLLSITTKVSPAEMAHLDLEAPPIWTAIAPLGIWLIYPGMWGAILSSAFGSALGGPRVLQALAADGLVPRFLARTSRTGQPTIATWVGGSIALAGVALGGLDAVGRWVTIFFLTLYVTVNMSAAIEKLVRDPSYRPTINVPWYVSFAGSVGAVSVMFLINPLACIAAVVFELLLWLFLRRRALERSWGDVRAGVWMALARFSLLQLRDNAGDARNWRPHILLFAGDLAKRIELVRMASWFNQDRGVLTVCQVISGNLEQADLDLDRRQREMDAILERNGLVAFGTVVAMRDFQQGVLDIVQTNGLAGMQSNTVMFGWPARQERLAAQLAVMRAVADRGKSAIFTRFNWRQGPRLSRRIDVWWRGKQNNGDLMLLLAYLLSLNAEWRGCGIFVRTIVEDPAERDDMAAGLIELIGETRIRAETDVIIKPPDQSLTELMRAQSHNADLVFLGLRDPAVGTEDAYARWLTDLTEGFPTTILVRNAGRFAGKLI